MFTSTAAFADADPTKSGPPNAAEATFVREIQADLMKRVASIKDVPVIFLFPTIWDLIVWVKPNPAGAFADKNPTVTP